MVDNCDARDAASLLPGLFSLVVTQDGNPSFAVDFDVEYVYDRRRIGFASLLFFPQHRRLEWHGFYPNKFRRLPERCGLGTLAHTATLLEVAQRAKVTSDDLVCHDLFLTSRSRQLHLEAMGIPYLTPLPFGEYLDRSLRYASARGFSFLV